MNTPTIHPDILELARRERSFWDALSDAIPAWHPRNEGEAAGDGGSPTAAQPGAGEQPDTGRGDVDHLAGLYDLSTAPEALRPHLQEELRKINAGVGRRFQEHAEFRQQFEPLQGIDGLADTPPEDLEDLLAVRNMIVAATDESNPDDGQLYEWWEKLGEHFQFFGGDRDDGGEPGEEPGDLGGEEPPEWAQQIMEENRQLRERLDGTERSTRAQQAEQAVQAELNQLVEKHSLDEDAQARVLQLAYAYGGAEDALQKGLADYFAISGKAEAGLLDGNRPGPTTPAGGQVPGPGSEEPMRLGDKRLRAAALARVQGQSTGAAA